MIAAGLCGCLLMACASATVVAGNQPPSPVSTETEVQPPVAAPGEQPVGSTEDVGRGEVAEPTPVTATCRKEVFMTVGASKIWRIVGQDAFFFESGMTIDADGAPDAYHPDNIGTDLLGNAGRSANWWALVTDTGRHDGTPVVQGPDDPNPGYYISTTALEDQSKPARDPRRYVNSNEIPFFVLPVNQRGGATLGDFGVVVNRANGKLAYALLADLGPRGHLGEGSIALAEALGINSNPRAGGAARGVAYVVFPGSGNGKPRSIEDINAEGERLFRVWGGKPQLDACLESSE
jgi:hypothetical protein